MSRKPVHPLQYVAELNVRLWADSAFCEGMAFKLYPDGKIGPYLRDADAAGSCSIPPVFARIEAQVAREFEILVPVPETAPDSAWH